MPTALHMEAAWGYSSNLQTTSSKSSIAKFSQASLENCCCMLLFYDSAPDEKITVSMVDLSDLDVDHLSTRGFWDLSAEVLSESSKRWSLLFLYSTKREADNKDDNWECFDECHVLECKPYWNHLLRSIIASLVLSCTKKMPLQLSASSPFWFRMISICFGFLSFRYATFQSVAAYLRKSQHRLFPGFSDRLDMELLKQTTTFCDVFLLDYHGLSTVSIL